MEQAMISSNNRQKILEKSIRSAKRGLVLLVTKHFVRRCKLRYNITLSTYSSSPTCSFLLLPACFDNNNLLQNFVFSQALVGRGIAPHRSLASRGAGKLPFQ
jgi:hypothetical protein